MSNDFDLFASDPEWKEHWVGMPEYDNSYIPPPVITATFKFDSEESFQDFLAKIKEHVYEGQQPFDGMQRKDVKSTWYPLREKASALRIVDES